MRKSAIADASFSTPQVPSFYPYCNSHLRHDLPVGDEVSLAVDHVGDHDDLVDGRVRELEWELGGLDVVGQHDAVRTLDDILALCEHGMLRRAPAADLGENQSNWESNGSGFKPNPPNSQYI